MNPGVSTTAISGSPNESQNATKRAAFSEPSASSTPPRWCGWLATIPTGRPSIRANVGHHVARPARAQLEQRAAVDDPARARRARRRPGAAPTARRRPGRTISGQAGSTTGSGSAGRRRAGTTAARGLASAATTLVVLDQVADAVALVHARTAEPTAASISSPSASRTTPGPGEEHRGVLGHQDQVGQRRRVGAAAGRCARHDRDLRNDAGQPDRVAEDPAVAGERRLCPPASGRRRTRRTRPPGSGPARPSASTRTIVSAWLLARAIRRGTSRPRRSTRSAARRRCRWRRGRRPRATARAPSRARDHARAQRPARCPGRTAPRAARADRAAGLLAFERSRSSIAAPLNTSVDVVAAERERVRDRDRRVAVRQTSGRASPGT